MNNFRVGFFQTYNYYNFSERVDYNINDNWRVFGRIGRYHTEDLQDDPTPNNSQLFVPTGTLRRGDADLGRRGVDGELRPRSSIFTATGTRWSTPMFPRPCRKADGATSGRATTGTGFPGRFARRASVLPEPRHRRQRISAAAASTGTRRRKARRSTPRFRNQRGSHYLKAGLEYRRSYGLSFVSNTSRFNFPASLTANTPVNPNTLDTGSAVASFLLGAMNPDATQMIGGPAPDPHIKYWGMFIQDDWKISRNITLNLGLRNEYETGFTILSVTSREGSICPLPFRR